MLRSTPSGPSKRKQPSHSVKSHRPAKRVKISNARTILTQTSDKALSKNGDLDVSAFVKAREFEIKSMVGSMGASKRSLSSRAFQQVPKDLRRRTASHNAKRVPKRLRARAAREMKDDNTPTVTSRRRKPTPHQRLRLEKAKELKKLGALTKKKRDESKKQKAGETDPEKMVSIAPRIPKLKKDTLSNPSKPPARFRKRQIHKSWLPTHLYHAKRAHMTPPKEPLWRFSIPMTPTDKCYRTTHRAASLRGCVAWDMSYMATIGVEGVENSLLGLLRSVGVEERMLVGRREVKWRRGTRYWQGWIRRRDGDKRPIAKVVIVWCVDSSTAEEKEIVDEKKEGTQGSQEEEAAQDMDATRDKEDGQDQEGRQNVAAGHKNAFNEATKKSRRKLLLRVHPSAFLEVWNETLKVAKIQRPAAMVEDLRFEMGSIEIIGPGSTEALIGALHPIPASIEAMEKATETDRDNEWVDIETSEQVWPHLVATSNPGALPANVVLGFSISDPRLHHPPRTVQQPSQKLANEKLLELLSTWPPDQTQTSADIFDRTKRLTASRQLSSQKAINRRKGEAPPGAYPASSPKDPKIPVLLLASRSSINAGQGSWTLLLPWDCVLPVWYSLMHYPLSSGGNPRFGGLQEKRQIIYEHGSPWYPGDYPGTKAGFEWELRERIRKKLEWERRPKGKRTAWESVDLGGGKKGEIGMGWACDWERLLEGPPSLPMTIGVEKGGSKKAEPEKSAKATKDTPLGKSSAASSSNPAQEKPPAEASKPPLEIHYLASPLSIKGHIPPTSLSPVHLTLIATGHPTRNARIYRLPTTNNDLRSRWLDLAHPSKPSKHSRQSCLAPGIMKKMSAHQRSQALAASLLNPSLGSSSSVTGGVPKAGDASYPCVPDEIDLIGFVTTGNYNLGEGKCEAIGNVAAARVLGEENKKGKGGERNLCILRESGQSIGRLARWKFV